MAYINVAEWSPDKVTDWLKGLDNSMYHYIQSFTNNEVRGQQLLNIRPYELEQLGMYSIGHQEIVLEAVEHLRNFHYHLDKENLQFLALHIATAAQCLHNQLARIADKSKLETQILSDVTRTIAAIKPLIGWLDRAPFLRINRFVELRNKMLRYAIEMATMAQRDRFVENPVEQIRQTAWLVANLANYIIQDVSDVMILQPATLNLVTLKKKESELGFNIVPSYHGIHVVTDIKYNSPAHTSGKIEHGDEIVQINYQTVVGWHYKKVIQQLHESPPDILLTLKKRPKHSKIYGQIYMKPYRLPSKKKAPTYRWGGGDGLPSPRVADLLLLAPAPPTKRDIVAAAASFPMPPVGQTVVVMNSTAKPIAAGQRNAIGAAATSADASLTADVRRAKVAAAAAAFDSIAAGAGNKPFTSSSSSSSAANTSSGITSASSGTTAGQASAAVVTSGAASDSDDCSDIMTPTDRKASTKDLRLYLPKTRAVLQRRNTICGDQVTGFKGNNVMFWHEYKDGEADSPSLRDKSVSFGFGLEIATARPTTTCLGMIGQNGPARFTEFGGLKGSLPDIVENGGGRITQTQQNQTDREDTLGRPQGISKVVRFDSSKKCNEYKDSRYACNVDNTILEVFEPIPYVDDEEEALTAAATNDQSAASSVDMRPADVEAGLTQAVNEVLVRREIEKWEQKTAGSMKGTHDIDLPPAIEPRSEFLHKTPPAPPPRPRKLTTIPASASASALSSSASFHVKPPHHQHQLNSHLGNHALPATLPKPSPRNHLHISEPIRDLHLHQHLHQHQPQQQQQQQHQYQPTPAPVQPIPPQPIYNSQQQLQLSESFLQPDPNNDIVEYNNTRSLREELAAAAAEHDAESSEPAEALELVTPNKTKNLTLKKKNSIMAKRRNITLKTLEVSDIQGHLYRRTKDKHGITYWAKLYMVLTDTSLYGFRSKDSDKADCLIFLNGFTVSLANEVHSKPFAFKVYHPSKTFYFAAESQLALAQWIEYIRKATLKGSSAALDSRIHSGAEQPVNVRELFSETESSDGEVDFGLAHKMLGTPSPIASGSRFGHKKSFCGSNASNLNATEADGAAAKPETTGKSEKYHLGFGSLKKFSWSSSASKAAKAEKKLAAASHSDVPVPTPQFRSYRKVPGNAGLQLGTNSMISSPMSTTSASSDFGMPLNSMLSPVQQSVLDFHSPMRGSKANAAAAPAELSTSRSMSQAPKASDSTQPLPQPSTPVVLFQPAGTSSPTTIAGDDDDDEDDDSMCDSFQNVRDHRFRSKKLHKNSPYHYIHASNPNLVEFDFPTAKTLDYSFPKVNPSNGWESTGHHHHMHSNSLQGFVTLKDLMLQKQEEDAKEMYNNRVTLGVEKKRDPAKAAMMQQQQQQQQQQQLQQSGPLLHARRAHNSSASNAATSSATAAAAAAAATAATAEDATSQYGGSTTGSERYNKFQNRSLPKTPDYAQSFKPDDSDIIMTRSREGQKLRDFGYEFISGDDGPGTTTKSGRSASGAGSLQSAAVASSTVVATAAVVTATASSAQKKKMTGLQWIGGAVSAATSRSSDATADDRTGSQSSRTGSIKKTSKGKLMADTLETFKSNSEKLLQFKHQQQPHRLPTTPPEKPNKPSYLPLTLPLSNKSNKQPATHVYNMHGQPLAAAVVTIDENQPLRHAAGGSGMKKSLTYNGGTDFAAAAGAGAVVSPTHSIGAAAMASTSSSSVTSPAPASMFPKMSFGGGGGSNGSGSGKEKKLLGSPRLHRALFGQAGSGRGREFEQLDHEPFKPMEPKSRPIVHEHDIADIAPTQLPPPTPHRLPGMVGGSGGAGAGSAFGSAASEYPHLEYPPVFKAETYSLNDPNASLTLRRRNNPSNRSK